MNLLSATAILVPPSSSDTALSRLHAYPRDVATQLLLPWHRLPRLATHVNIMTLLLAGSRADKGLQAQLDYMREECKAAQAVCKELQIKKNAAEARLVGVPSLLHTPLHQTC